MGGETKYECGVCRDLRTDDNGNECRACAPADPHAPTPAADGEADAWIVAGEQVDTWNQIVRECQPHLDGRMHPEKFAEMLMAYGASCARAALRARPLPDDVRDALVRVVRDADAAKMGDTPVVKLCEALGINTGSTHTEIADALLSRAPRPEPGEVRDIREARLAPLRSVAVQVMKLGRTCSRDEVIEIVHGMMETVHRQEVGA